MSLDFFFGLCKILLMKKNCHFLEDCTRHLEQSFVQKEKFWENGIMELLEKWQKVVKQNNKYIGQ